MGLSNIVVDSGGFRFKKVEKHWFNVKQGQFKQLTFHIGLIPVSNFTVWEKKQILQNYTRCAVSE